MDIYMEESNNKSTYWNCLFILKGCRSTIDTNTWWRVYSICAYRICVQTACIYSDFHLKSKTMVGWWWRARECAHRKSNWKSVAQNKRDNDKSIRIECMWHAKYAWVPTIGQGNYHTIILNWRNDISKHTHHSSADTHTIRPVGNLKLNFELGKIHLWLLFNSMQIDSSCRDGWYALMWWRALLKFKTRFVHQFMVTNEKSMHSNKINSTINWNPK